MIQARVTKKEVQQYYQYVISVPLPSDYFFMAFEPAYYTVGKYGWNADVYHFGDTALVTGYRSFGKQVSRDDMAYWETEAEKVIKGTPWDKWQLHMTELVQRFIRAHKD